MQPKNDKRTTVILISLFLFFAPLISANDWFMNPKGSQSSGCGTDKSNPCGILTLILNNEQFQANDTVYWQSGHYNPCSIQNLTATISVSTSFIGLDSVSISAVSCGLFNVISNCYFYLENIAFINSNALSPIINIVSSTVSFENCSFVGNMNGNLIHGISSIDSNFVTFSNCLFQSNSMQCSPEEIPNPINCNFANVIDLAGYYLQIFNSSFVGNSLSISDGSIQSVDTSIRGVISCSFCIIQFDTVLFQSNMVYIFASTNFHSLLSGICGVAACLQQMLSDQNHSMINCTFLDNAVQYAYLAKSSTLPDLSGSILTMSGNFFPNLNIQNFLFLNNSIQGPSSCSATTPFISLISITNFLQTNFSQIFVEYNSISLCNSVTGVSNVSFIYINGLGSLFVEDFHISKSKILAGNSALDLGSYLSAVMFSTIGYLTLQGKIIAHKISLICGSGIIGGSSSGLFVLNAVTNANIINMNFTSNLLKAGNGFQTRYQSTAPGGNVDGLLVLAFSDYVRIENSFFSDNTLLPGSGNSFQAKTDGQGGGAISVRTCFSVLISNCSISSNSLGATFLESSLLGGAGLQSINSTLNVVDTQFLFNIVLGRNVSGAAVLLVDSSSGNFSNCFFSFNELLGGDNDQDAVGYGGAMAIASGSAFQISNSFFFLNLMDTSTAHGGSVFVSFDSSLTTENNVWFRSFGSNYGGAIRSDSLDFSVSSSDVFLANFAGAGGGAIFVRAPTFGLREICSNISGNYAYYGSSCASDLMGLKFFNQDGSQSTTFEAEPGRAQQLTFLVFDGFLNIILDSSMTVSLTTESTDFTVSSTRVFSQDNGLFSFTNAVLLADPNTQLNITASVSSDYAQASLTLTVDVTECNFGEFLSGGSCVLCPPGTYSSGGKQSRCVACPEGANCTTPTLILARSRYWCYFSDQTQMVACVMCSSDGCCTSETGCPWNQSCIASRTGVLCGECITGYSESSVSDVCVPTESCEVGSIVSVVFRAFAASILPVLTLFILGTSSSGSLASAISYMQLVPMIVGNADLPTVLFDLVRLDLSAFYSVSQSEDQCLWKEANSVSKFAVMSLVGPLFGLVWLGIVMFFSILMGRIALLRKFAAFQDNWVERKKARAKTKKAKVFAFILGFLLKLRNRFSFDKHAYSAVFMGLVIGLFVPVFSTIAVLLSCVDLDTNNHLLLMGDVHCYEPLWQRLLFIPLIVLCAAPFIQFVGHNRLKQVHERQRLSGDEGEVKILEHVQLLQQGYRDELWFWESVQMIRRIVLVLVIVFVQDKVESMIVVSIICLTASLLHTHFRPFKDWKWQTLEMLYLFSMTVLSFLELFSNTWIAAGGTLQNSKFFPSIVYFEVFIVFFPLGIFVIAKTYAWADEIWQFYRKWKQNQILQQQHFKNSNVNNDDDIVGNGGSFVKQEEEEQEEQDYENHEKRISQQSESLLAKNENDDKS